MNDLTAVFWIFWCWWVFLSLWGLRVFFGTLGVFFGFAAKLNVWFQEVYVPSQNNLDTFVLPYLLSSWNEFCV